MRQRLVVIGDGRSIDRRVELLGNVVGRQLPQPTEQALRRAAHEHDLVTVLQPDQHPREHRQVGGLLARRYHRQRVLATRRVRGAQRRERACETARLRRRAHRRAELHEALIQITRRGCGRQRGHQLARSGPQRLLPRCRLDVVLDREHAAEHAGHVAVDEGRALAVRDRCDRTGGVGPDARHVAQLGCGARQRLADGLRTAVQVARARVVTQARPRGEHVVERRGRECTHRRERRHPLLPVRDHRGDPRLLQHDLADPDRVRIARATPWQIALHAAVVSDDGVRDRSGIHGGVVAQFAAARLGLSRAGDQEFPSHERRRPVVTCHHVSASLQRRYRRAAMVLILRIHPAWNTHA